MNALMPSNTALLNKKILKQVLSILLMSTFLIVFAVESAKGSSRIKDITSFEGVRENMLNTRFSLTQPYQLHSSCH